jgi:hypothetical protein
MAADCLGGQYAKAKAAAFGQSESGSIAENPKYDGPSINSKQFEGPKAPNVGKR